MVLAEGEGILLVALLFAPLVTGALVHFSVEPGARHWHRRLRKSSIAPPPVVFPLMWISNYLCIGYASFLVAKKSWGVPFAVAHLFHLVLLNSWNPIFFTLRRIDMALCVMVALNITVPILMFAAASIAPMAAIITVPYYLWILLSTYLTFYMWKMNPGPHFGFNKDEVKRQHEQPLSKTE